MLYPGFPKLVSLWKGIVRIDCSLVDNTSKGLDYDDYRIVTIKDSKFKKEDNAQLDNYDELVDFPNEIVLFISGNEILERMWCTVVKGYKEEQPKKLFQRSYNVLKNVKSLACKGFILEPIMADDILKVDACLGLLQFDNEYGQQISFDRLGMYVFTSGSQTSNVTLLKDPRRSVTATFVASKDKPLITYIYSKDKTLKFFCDDFGIKVNQIVKNKQETQHSHTPEKGAIEILKTRLAMGEITIEEYERVRRKIVEDENYSSNWI